MNFRQIQHIIPAAFVAVLVAAFALTARAGEPAWIVDESTGCQIWDNDPQPNESIHWTGACANGAAQGKGVVQWPSGRHYEGELRDGKFEGYGVEIDASGNRYGGEFHDSMRTALAAASALSCR
jgi:hypothetical protein